MNDDNLDSDLFASTNIPFLQIYYLLFFCLFVYKFISLVSPLIYAKSLGDVRCSRDSYHTLIT